MDYKYKYLKYKSKYLELKQKGFGNFFKFNENDNTLKTIDAEIIEDEDDKKNKKNKNKINKINKTFSSNRSDLLKKIKAYIFDDNDDNDEKNEIIEDKNNNIIKNYWKYFFKAFKKINTNKIIIKLKIPSTVYNKLYDLSIMAEYNTTNINKAYEIKEEEEKNALSVK